MWNYVDESEIYRPMISNVKTSDVMYVALNTAW